MIIVKETQCPEYKPARCPNYIPRFEDCVDEPYDDRPPEPCGTTVGSGGGLVTRKRHSLGPTPGAVVFTYEAYSLKDRFDIYVGGVLVATTGDFVDGNGQLNFYYTPTPDQVCTIIVTGQNPDTVWEYTLNCPI